ncbi:MAG: Gfo/Idh/MocA family protein, partial [Tannerellaceae bacterium]
AQAFASKYGVEHCFASIEEMVSGDVVDAVYIASPNALHASQAILCMNHGKHVLCEKAFASNVREADAMIDAAKLNGVALMEAMKTTLTPNFLAIREHLHRIGTVRRYFASYCQYSSRYDKYKEGIVLNAFNPAFSNGALVDIGVYTIYPMVVLFGMPNSIEASGLLLDSGVDGQGSVIFKYDSMDAVVMYSKIADSYLPMEIQGEDGSITSAKTNIISNVMLRERKGEELLLDTQNPKDEYYYEVAEFIDVICNGKQESSVNTWACSRSVVAIMDEVRRQIGVIYPADQSAVGE